ncbi:HD-GYP domain-containing protein [Helicovermis profundi]|uniref:HD-GYP domain-containing protein n=1 Tax=Helicovermis profundi TaxID=3065157 RepID=A0AAU9E929_9FIRM|nr:HD-GYP domain-containing protein [Clostridia bacterium S502]
MRIVPVNSVKGEAYLARDLYNSKSKVLLKRGVLLTEHLLKKIHNNNIYTIYIEDKYSSESIKEVIKPELRIKAIETIKETFKNIEKDNRFSKKESQGLKKNLGIRRMEKYLDNMKSISESIIEDLTSNTNLLVNLVDLKNVSTYTYEHSVNVAIISLVLGMELKFSRNELQTLFIGALLHDIGKTLLPEEIINKEEKLSETEKELTKTHSQLGYNYLKENFALSTKSNIVVLQHHERFDGLGYPNGTYGKAIHLYSRIVAVANVFDSMTSDKPSSNAIMPNEALEFIMGNAGKQFDFEIVDIFSKKIMLYTVGTLVMLSNNAPCVVVSQNTNLPLRPKVKVIDKRRKDYNEIYDLSIKTNIVISSVIYNYSDENV